MLARNWRVLVALVALVAVVGCTEPATHPETIAVTGTVTYNGDAVEGARVSFSPEGDGHAASGTTDAQGVFSLTSFEAGDGAVAGSYTVGVQKTEGGVDVGEAVPAGVDPESEEAMDAAYTAMEAAAGKPEGEAKDLLPAKYKDPATSGFTADVAAGAENNFKFDLAD